MINNVILNKTMKDYYYYKKTYKYCIKIKEDYKKCLEENNHKIYFCQDLRYKYEKCVKNYY